jgi:hypothetical protein
MGRNQTAAQHSECTAAVQWLPGASLARGNFCRARPRLYEYCIHTPARTAPATPRVAESRHGPQPNRDPA